MMTLTSTAASGRRAHLCNRRSRDFAGLTLFDFQRLRRTEDIRTAPLLAAAIFLDALNVFLFLPVDLRRRRVGRPGL